MGERINQRKEVKEGKNRRKIEREGNEGVKEGEHRG